MPGRRISWRSVGRRLRCDSSGDTHLPVSMDRFSASITRISAMLLRVVGDQGHQPAVVLLAWAKAGRIAICAMWPSPTTA